MSQNRPETIHVYTVELRNAVTGEVRVYLVPARSEAEAEERASVMLFMDLLMGDLLVAEPTAPDSKPDSKGVTGSHRPIGFVH